MTTRAIGESGELIVFPSAQKTFLVLLGSLAFALVGGFLLFLWAIGRGGPGAAIAGASCTAFFGFCSLYGIFRLVVQRPALLIDARGITDNASALALGLVRWDEIAEMGEYQFRGQTMLGVVPKDLDAILARVHPIKRLAIRANLGLGAIRHSRKTLRHPTYL